MGNTAAGFNFRNKHRRWTDQLSHLLNVRRPICERERKVVDAHLAPNLDCLAVLDRNGRQLDVATHVASLVAADTTAFADSQNSPVACNLHNLGNDGMEVNGDEIANP